MQVPLLDLSREYDIIRDEIKSVINDILEEQKFIMGPQIKEFETAVQDKNNIEFAFGCASGSAALMLALLSIDIKPGDEVITTPYTFFATAGAVHLLGAKPVFVDIEPDTFNINPNKIQDAITSKTKAVIAVHLYGQCADMEPIVEVAKKNNIYVIEDAAQAITAEYKGNKAGTLGDIGTYSFFPSKNLGCAGDGGMVVTKHSDLAEKINILRKHGSKPKYFHKMVGMNSRLDTIQAGILLVKLKYLDRWSHGRQQNAEKYRQLLNDISDVVTLPLQKEYSTQHIYNQFVIKVQNRDELKEYLTNNGVSTAIYYPLSLHEQECFKYLGYTKGDFPVSEKCASESLALPIFPYLTEEEINYVSEIIHRFYTQT